MSVLAGRQQLVQPAVALCTLHAAAVFLLGEGENSPARLDPQSCRCLVHPIESVMQHQRLRSLRSGLHHPAPPCPLAAPSVLAHLQPISWRLVLSLAHVENTSRKCIAAVENAHAGRYSVFLCLSPPVPLYVVFRALPQYNGSRTEQELQELHRALSLSQHKKSDSPSLLLPTNPPHHPRAFCCMRLDRTLHAGTQAWARLLPGVLGCCSSTSSLHVRTPAGSFLQQQ